MSDGYTLRLLAEAGDLRHYRLVPSSGGRMESTDIVFTADHIVICGDLAPCRHGVVSDVGYGIGWFSCGKSKGYLSEKFLETDWHRELAIAELDDFEDDEGNGLDEESKRELRGYAEDGDVRGFYDWFTDQGYDVEYVPGFGYEPREQRLLVEIHERFVRLYAESRDRRGRSVIEVLRSFWRWLRPMAAGGAR